MNLKHLKTYENFTINEGVYSNLEDDYESSVINILKKSINYYEELDGDDSTKMKITFNDGSIAYINPTSFKKVTTTDEHPSDADYFVKIYREGTSYDKLISFVKRNCTEK